MQICGFVLTKKPLKTIKGAIHPTEFENQMCRVMEFSRIDGSALIFNPQGNALASIDKEDIERSFRCKEHNGIIMPPDLDEIGEMIYISACINRRGGYSPIIARLVIAASLHRNEFCDSVLWAYEPAPNLDAFKKKTQH